MTMQFEFPGCCKAQIVGSFGYGEAGHNPPSGADYPVVYSRAKQRIDDIIRTARRYGQPRMLVAITTETQTHAIAALTDAGFKPVFEVMTTNNRKMTQWAFDCNLKDKEA